MRYFYFFTILLSIASFSNLNAQYTNSGYIWSRTSSAGGGTLIQDVADSENSYTRSLFSNNVYWDKTANRWKGRIQGANDISAILVPNGGGFQFVFHHSTGNTYRDFTHSEFMAGHRLSIDNWGNLKFTTGHGRGVLFWDSGDYRIHMSEIGNSSYGGRVNGETTSDYNMYFRMGNGTNRGFVFQNKNDSYFSIHPNMIFSEVPINIVDGKILAEEVKVQTVPASDYVFEPDYDLKPLEEVDQFIQQNKHLPDIPSAEEFATNGVGLGEMDDMLLRKVEELTLYTIRQETELVAKGNEIKLLKAESELLKAQIAELAELKLLVKELLDK
jgi:hypothetical protein